MRSKEDHSTEREEIQADLSETYYNQFTAMIGDHNVQAICEKYGVDWESDVIQNILQDQDFDDKVQSASDPTKGSAAIGKGKDFDKRDVHEILMCLGKMQMFTKLIEEKVTEGGTRNEKMASALVREVSSEVIDFLGVFNVPEVAEDSGFSWEDDVLVRVSSGQV